LWKAPKSRADGYPQPPADLADIVRKQFGPCFSVARERSAMKVNYLHPQDNGLPWIIFLTADLDGDGVEDAIIVARCKTPLIDEANYNYHVVDPYYTNYGYGNPRVTTQFSASDPTRQNLVLVIHGAGKEAWRAAVPKAKFVFINLPFDTLSITRVTYHKRPIAGLNLTEDEEQTSSVVFWDIKTRKYRWSESGGE
jgi:hypothetical protein